MTSQPNKDLSELRYNPSAENQVNLKNAPLKDIGARHRVQIFWHMNDEAKRDQIFVLQVNGQNIYLDKQDVLRAIRVI